MLANPRPPGYNDCIRTDERKDNPMKATPITAEQLNAWSEDYRNSEARQLATLALGKTDLKDAIFSSRALSPCSPSFPSISPRCR